MKTDRKAALTLARLNAVGMLTGIWILPHPVRDLRSLIAQQEKMVRLSTIAMNRLHVLLHWKNLILPQKPFSPEVRAWWESLPLSVSEQVPVQSNLDTFEFAQKQIEQNEACLKRESAQDDRIPFLIRLPGVTIALG